MIYALKLSSCIHNIIFCQQNNITILVGMQTIFYKRDFKTNGPENSEKKSPSFPSHPYLNTDWQQLWLNISGQIKIQRNDDVKENKVNLL